MDQESIRRYIGSQFSGVDITVASNDTGAPELAWGDTFFIYDPRHDLPPSRQFPFATIVTKDYAEFDNASNLDRPGVFRLNVGVSKKTFQSLFEEDEVHDFTALDTLMPHPIYASNHFVCVLNPSDATFEKLKPLLLEAYQIAVARVENRSSKR